MKIFYWTGIVLFNAVRIGLSFVIAWCAARWTADPFIGILAFVAYWLGIIHAHRRLARSH